MSFRKGIVSLLCVLGIGMGSLYGQSSSLHAYSPYTFYGLGDVQTVGPAFLRSMGGIGVAYSNPRRANYANPASFAEINPKSVLFNVGLETGGVYSKTATHESSYNPFYFRDVAFQAPITEGLGFGVSVTPYSSVGYQIEMSEMDPEILANVGDVTYRYLGSGNITQAKVGLGAKLFEGFSLGVDMIYYHGKINRDFVTQFNSTIVNSTNSQLIGITYENYSNIWLQAGFQYRVIDEAKRRLTLAAVVKPQFNMRPMHTRSVYVAGVYNDSVAYSQGREDFYMPTDVTAGFIYTTEKMMFGVDYNFQGWGNLNTDVEVDGIDYRNTNSIRSGFQYTPNAQDVRSYFRRISYRIGYRYSDYYMNFNGQSIHDQAITFGLGLPLRQGLTNIDLGFELGQRGNTRTGTYDTRTYEMIQERYFKVSVGFSLFGEDYWFTKYKYE